MTFRARWKGPNGPPAALLALTVCRYDESSAGDAALEALAVLGVEIVECCHAEDGARCADCERDAEARTEAAADHQESYRAPAPSPLELRNQDADRGALPGWSEPRRGW